MALHLSSHRVLIVAFCFCPCVWGQAPDNPFGEAVPGPLQDAPKAQRVGDQQPQASPVEDPEQNPERHPERDPEHNPEQHPEDKKLDAFFDELEKVVQGNDDRAKAIKQMLGELKLEYADLELQLQDVPLDPDIFNRLLLIAQYHQNLSARSVSRDPRRMHEVLRLISDRVRDFRRENPELAKKREFRERESALRSRAMQMNRFGGMGAQESQSLKQTMQSLSAGGRVIDRWAPQRLRAHPGEVDGALQAAHFTLRRLLRLRWDGEFLSLSRSHWDEAFAGQSPTEIQADVNHLLEKRGVEPFRSDDERQRFVRMVQQGAPGQPTHIANLGRLFQEFYTGGGRSYSSGGNAGRWSTQSSDTAVSMEANPTDFTLSIAELHHPRRLLRIQSSSTDSLSIVLLGDFIHRYQQQVDASGNTRVQVTEILDDEVLHYKAKSFAELYRQHPRYVEDRFLPLLDHLGIIPPHSRFDPAITSRVVELLTADQTETRKAFEEIAKNLDVDKFTHREAAFRKLQADLGQYLPLLFEKRGDPSLSREARARITKLIEIGNQNGTAELDATIGKLRLTSDVDYLNELSETLGREARARLQAHVQNLEASEQGSE